MLRWAKTLKLNWPINDTKITKWETLIFGTTYPINIWQNGLFKTYNRNQWIENKKWMDDERIESNS